MRAAKMKLGWFLILAVVIWVAATHGSSAQEQKAHVLVFVTTDCPISNALMPEVSKLMDQYIKKGVTFTLAYVDPNMTVQEMRDHVEQHGLSAASTVLDPKHELVAEQKAERTPEAFVATKDHTVVYHGRINDLFHAPGKRKRAPHSHEVRDAIEAVLADRKPKIAYEPAVGCVIADFKK